MSKKQYHRQAKAGYRNGKRLVWLYGENCAWEYLANYMPMPEDVSERAYAYWLGVWRAVWDATLRREARFRNISKSGVVL